MSAQHISERHPMNQTPQLRDDNWSQLLTQVAMQRSEVAFAKLFKHFAPLIKGFCQANISWLAADSAEEQVQEVMIKIWQKAPDFDPSRASASTWIFTITRNARIDYLRKNAKHSHGNQTLEADDIWDEDADNQPFVFLQRNREEKEVGDYLRSLPEEQGLCIEKVYIEGKSHTEIAEELDIPLGTVKSRVRLGLKKLQSHTHVVLR